MYILRSVHLTNVLNEFYYYCFQSIHCFFDEKNYFNSLLAAKGVKYSGKPHGTILTVDIAGHNGDLHAVATISLAPEEIYYLDPNIGLFKVNKQFSLMDINSKIQNTYRGAQVLAQIIITRK